jgi:hypothetical protein
VTTLKINKGDSAKIAIQIPLNRVLYLQDIQVNVGNLIIGKLSTSTITVDASVSNLYYVNIPSNVSDKLAGSKSPVIVAIYWSDLGVRKTWEANSLILWVGSNRNSFSNNSNSGAVDATINITFNDDNLIVDNKIATIFRGYSALDLYRIEIGNLDATFSDLMTSYYGKKSVVITNLQNGAIITHSLGGYVLTKFINSSGEQLIGVYGEKILNNLNQVTFRTPILDDILNQTYTGILICEKY